MLVHELHHASTMVFIQSAAQGPQGPILMGGALEGPWPHKHEDVGFTQKWVSEGQSALRVDHAILQLHNYTNVELA